MINPNLYHKTVGILSKAYIDNTLVVGNCAACAVGNIIAANMGITLEIDDENVTWKNAYPEWQCVFSTHTSDISIPFFRRKHYQRIRKENYALEARTQIDSTGYSWKELAQIEYAFESNWKGDDPMFNSMMACIDVLNKIHQVSNENIIEQAKGKFVKPKHPCLV